MNATSTPASIKAVGVNADGQTKTESMIGGMGKSLMDTSGSMNQPTSGSGPFDLAKVQTMRIEPSNYMLAQMNVPNLSPLSRQIRPSLAQSPFGQNLM